jgi:chemotaxis protein methyltransferase CheR/type IV pilus assembly protein PilK
MPSEEFVLWQTLLEERTGMWLPETRKVFLTTALASHMKTKGISCYSELYSKLSANAISVLDWAALVDALTVHETCYYREDSSLRLVSNYCRNKALEGFEKAPDKPQTIDIWSLLYQIC